MKLQGASAGELACASELTAACGNVANLIAEFSGLGVFRDLPEEELSPEIGLRQLAIYNELQTATAALANMTAATPLEVARLGGIIKLLRDRLGFCGFDELTALIRAHERDLTRLASREADRAGQANWISRRLVGFFSRSDCVTEH